VSSVPSAIVSLLRDAEELLLVCHEQPDADALGSMLGMAAALQADGRRVHCGCADPVPARYRFLPGSAQVTAEVAPAPLAVLLDAAEWSRLGVLAGVAQACPQALILDHHPPGIVSEVPAWIDPSAAATATLVRRVLAALDLPLTPPVATCLYCALGGDTGYFTYQNTDTETLLLAAELVGAGADPYGIHSQASDQHPLSHLHLRARALASAQVAASGRLAYAVLTEQDFLETGAPPEATEGVVDELRQIEGAEVYVLFKHAGPAQWRVSLRSRDLDVGSVAREFSGGGHTVAAGCMLWGERETAVANLLQRLEKALSVEPGS
jgi:phosphoesterase RecJ-like protein